MLTAQVPDFHHQHPKAAQVAPLDCATLRTNHTILVNPLILPPTPYGPSRLGQQHRCYHDTANTKPCYSWTAHMIWTSQQLRKDHTIISHDDTILHHGHAIPQQAASSCVPLKMLGQQAPRLNPTSPCLCQTTHIGVLLADETCVVLSLF